MCQNADACMHIHHIHRVVLVVVCQSKRAFKQNLCQTNMFKKQLLKKGVEQSLHTSTLTSCSCAFFPRGKDAIDRRTDGRRSKKSHVKTRVSRVDDECDDVDVDDEKETKKCLWFVIH